MAVYLGAVDLLWEGAVYRLLRGLEENLKKKGSLVRTLTQTYGAFLYTISFRKCFMKEKNAPFVKKRE